MTWTTLSTRGWRGICIVLRGIRPSHNGKTFTFLQRIADVRLLHAHSGSPDMVFVAHSALVQHGIAAVSSFAHPQRQAEEQHLREWSQDEGFLVWETPRETAFEGEGDALFNAAGDRLWAAHGVRTCKHSHRHVADAWHTQVTSLHLVDPRFYHLDTCFAPLSGGHLLYFPGAFDTASLAKIEAAYAEDKRIAVSELEATRFACNVINVGRNILTSPVGRALLRGLWSWVMRLQSWNLRSLCGWRLG